MKLMTDRCCAANDSMFLLPFWSVSPNAYCAALVENKMAASANVIHPRSPGDSADKERASVASVVPSSFMVFGGATSSYSFSIRLIIPIPEVSCGLGKNTSRVCDRRFQLRGMGERLAAQQAWRRAATGQPNPVSLGS